MLSLIRAVCQCSRSSSSPSISSFRPFFEDFAKEGIVRVSIQIMWPNVSLKIVGSGVFALLICYYFSGFRIAPPNVRRNCEFSHVVSMRGECVGSHWPLPLMEG
jgi:hypothetical protein